MVMEDFLLGKKGEREWGSGNGDLWIDIKMICVCIEREIWRL
jgi:hypothetical protein